MLIYKYMSFREIYFRNFMLKASRYGEFNDPFDLVLGEYGMSLTEVDAKEFYDMMPEHYKTLDYYQETYLDIQAGARASIAIICFSETFEDILMWSHYADNHAGLCIGYDVECDFFNSMYSCSYSQNVGKLKPVTYSGERPQFITPCELVNDTSHWFRKAECWSYEKEHRILLPIDKASVIELDHDSVLGYKIDPVNIREIIFGCKMESEHKNFIHKELDGFDIDIIEASPHSSHYRLNFKKYDASDEISTAYNLGMDI